MGQSAKGNLAPARLSILSRERKWIIGCRMDCSPFIWGIVQSSKLRPFITARRSLLAGLLCANLFLMCIRRASSYRQMNSVPNTTRFGRSWPVTLYALTFWMCCRELLLTSTRSRRRVRSICHPLISNSDLAMDE